MFVYKPIRQMRKLTKKGQSFSFVFMSYSLEPQTSDDIVKVRHVRLHKRNKINFQLQESRLIPKSFDFINEQSHSKEGLFGVYCQVNVVYL